MKTTFVLATLTVVGASAVTAGAATFSPKPFQGSDALYDLTNGAIDPGLVLLPNGTLSGTSGLGIGTKGDYQGGGTGEDAMTAENPTQLAAPMSTMLTKKTCAVAGGVSDSAAHASGMGIGLDAVDLYSATNAGASVACNGNANDATATAGLNYGPSIAAAGGPYNNWTDMLALLYGGMDKSNKTVDCNSAKRKALVSNWSNLFQNGCGNGVSTCTTGLMKFGATNKTLSAAAGTTTPPLWHAFRRDDSSGTSDAFASLIGLGNLYDMNTSGLVIITDSVSSSALFGFGVSPYCNAMNWDSRTAVNERCRAGAGKQYLGPGGVDQGDHVHKVPPPGTWGTAPDPSSVNGVIAFSTSFQDNDPIRRPCVGRSTFVGS
ncbi:MAG: hypothetical protein ACRENE_14065, partial [Polyangiaceae bacterium]